VVAETTPDLEWLLKQIDAFRGPKTHYSGDTETRMNFELDLWKIGTQEKLISVIEGSIESQDRLASVNKWLTFVGVAIALFQLVGMFTIPFLTKG
jgi:hypothetical protein